MERWGMKTTIEVPDELFRRAKAKAAMEGLRLRDLVVRGLQLALEEPEPTRERTVFPLIRSNRPARVTVEQVSAALVTMDEEEDAQAVALSVRR